MKTLLPFPFIALLTTLALSAPAAPKSWDGGGGADHSWHNPLNWDNDTLPALDDDVTLAQGSVTLTNGLVAVRSFALSVPFTMDGGTLAVADSASVSATSFTFHGGSITNTLVLHNATLNFGPGSTGAASFLVIGNSTLTGPIAAAQTVEVRGGIGGYATLTAEGGVVNAGRVRIGSVNGYNARLITAAGAFTNAPGGVIEALAGSQPDSYLEGAFVNQGTLLARSNAVLHASGSVVQTTGSLMGEGLFRQNDGLLDLQGGTVIGAVHVLAAAVRVGAAVSSANTIVCGSQNSLLLGNTSPGMTIAVEGGLYGFATLTATNAVVNAGRLTLHSINGYYAQLVTSGEGTITTTPTGMIEALDGNTPTSYLSGAFVNQGSLLVRSNASLQCAGTFHQTAGAMTGEGNFYHVSGLLDLQGGRTTGLIDVAGGAVRVGASLSGASHVRVGTQNSLFLGCASPLMTIAIEGGLYGYAMLTGTNGVANAGRITLHSVGGYWAQLVAGGGAITNTATGVIEALEGSLTTSYLNGAFVNQGSLLVRSNASLQCDGTFLQIAGQMIGEGNFYQATGLLDVQAGRTQGSIDVAGGALRVGASLSGQSLVRVGTQNSLFLGCASPLMTIAIEGGLYGYAMLTATNGVANAGRITLHSINGYYAQLVTSGEGTITTTPTGMIEALDGNTPTSYLSGAFVNQGSLLVRSNASLQCAGTFLQIAGQMIGEGNFYQATGLLDVQAGRTQGSIDVAGGALRVGASLSGQSFVRVGTQNSLFLGCASPLMTIAIEGGLYGYAMLTATNGVANAGRITLHSVGGYWAQLSSGGILTNAPTGVIEAMEGNQATSYLGGSFVNTGLLAVRSNASLQLGGSSFLNLDTGLVTGQGALNVSVAQFINSGTVAPGGTNGSPGTLTINGDFTQTVAGRLNIELGGLTASTHYDRLAVNGTALLFGTLNVTRFGGFTPAVEDVFLPVTYNSHGGQFGVLNGVDISAAIELRPTYLAGALELRGAIPTNPPATAPVIITPPQSQIASVGNYAAFYVTAGGTPTLGYQWQKGGVNLTGETNAVLALFNVQAAQAGAYRVIITNDFGSITSVVAQLTVVTPGSTVYWDGGGDGTNWLNPLNWSNDTVPTSTNDVVIDVAGINATITHHIGNTTVRSVQCQEGFILAGGSFTVTDGNSTFLGPASLSANTYLQAIGSNTVLNAAGVTNIDYASLYASGGAVLSLPGVRSYAKPVCGYYATWQASGAGSRIVLAGMTNLASSTYACGGYWLYLNALAGGRVELAAVQSLDVGYFNVQADGSNSVVDLSGVTSHDAAGSFVTLEARNQGQVLLSQLTDGASVDLTMRSGGLIPTAQWRRLHGLTLDGVTASFPALTTVSIGGAITLTDGAGLTAAGVTNIDYASLYASGGAVLSLPGVRSYAKPVCGYYATWQASGAGSRIVLAGMTNLASSTYACGGYWLYLNALAGGRVELAAVQSLDVGYFNVQADGSNSVVDLSGVTSHDAAGSFVTLEARNQGQVLLSQLTDGASVDLAMRSGGLIPTAQWRRLHGLTLDGVTASFPALTTVSIGGAITLTDGAGLTAAGVTNIDYASLYASGGAVLSLPGVRSYAKPVCGYYATWQASGAGSRIVLAGMTNLASSTYACGGYWLYLNALAGGRVELAAVQSLDVGYFNVQADGSNSVVDLSGVTSHDAAGSFVTLEARNQGQVLLSQLTDGASVDLTMRSGGLIPTAQWRRLHGLTLDGVTASFPALTSVSVGGAITLADGAGLTAAGLTNIDYASLWVSGGSVLSLPGVRSYAKPVCGYHATWQASGAGSRIVLAGLTNLASSPYACGGYWLYLNALAGGRVELAAVQSLDVGYFNLLADGSDSVVDLTGVTSQDPASSFVTVEARNQGQVLLSQLTDGGSVELTMRSGGLIPTGQWRRLHGLTLDGVTASFPALTSVSVGGAITLADGAGLTAAGVTNIDYASLWVSGGGVLSLPGVRSYAKPVCGYYATWQASGTGSRIVLAGLTNLASSPYACGSYWLFLNALAGGQVLLPNVTAIPEGYVQVRADGNNSLINLLSLQQTPPVLSTFQVLEQNGGIVLLPVPVDFIVTSLTPPPAALAGTLVPVSWVARNQGTNDATRARTDGIYLSPDPVFGNGNDLFIGHFSAGPLGAGQAQTVTHSVLVPPGLSGGYYFIVMADSLFQHYEGGAETNNVFINADLVSVSAADLVVTRVTPGTNTAEAGGTLAVEWVVRNEGAAPAPAAWNDTVQLTSGANTRTLATVPAPSGLGTDGVYTNRVTVTLPLGAEFPAGTATLTVTADTSGNQPESNEANNAATASFSLTQPPLPDLVAALVIAPVIATPGQPTTLTVVITNQGAVTANGGWLAEIRRSQGDQTNQSLLTSAATELLATFVVSNALAAGASLTVTQSIVIPADVPVTNAVFAVALDTAGAVAETNETNNVNFAANATALPLTLTLSAPFSEVREDAGMFSVLVTRSGDRARESLVGVISMPSPGAYPYTRIPSGAASATAFIYAVHDQGQFTDDTILVEANDMLGEYLGGFLSILVRNIDTPRLTLAASLSTISEGQSATITVTRDGPVDAPLIVTLTSSSGANLTVPPSVSIPAGTNRATVLASAADDAAVEADVDYNISAGAAGFASGAVSVRVNDNDAPVLTFRLDPPQVSEGAGATALFGTVERATNGASFARSLYLRLTSSDTNVAILPDLVRMAAYDASVRFPIAPIDNELVDGPRTVTLRAYALDGSGAVVGLPAVTNLTVTDDDGPALFVTLDNELVAEGRSPAAVATVRRNTPATNAVTVTLASSDTSEATVPPSVTLSNGQTSAIFPVASVADGATDGSQPVTISASANGFAPGSAVLTVTDRDLSDLVVRNVTTAASAFTEEYFSVGYAVRNIGLAAMPSNAVMQLRYYLSRDPYLGNDVIAVTPILIEVPGPIPPGQLLGQTVTLRAPRQPGDWWVVVEADVNTNAVVEAEEYNNATISVLPLRVNVAYTANVLTDVTSAPGGTPIPLRGSIAVALPGLPPAGLPVTIYVNGGGVRRTLAAFSDVNGNFTATFQPFANEGGLYEIAAAHPGAPAPTNAQDSFTLYGLRAEPSRESVRVTEGSSVQTTVTLGNLSSVTLNGIAAIVLGAAANLSVSANVAGTLPGDGTSPLTLTVGANDASVMNSTFTVRVTADGGVTNIVTVDVKVDPRTPRLVALPAELRAGMPRGVQTVVEFDVVNQGAAASGPISVTTPALPWMYIASTNPLPSIEPGETNRVTLVLTPASDLPLLEYNGALALNGTNSGVAVPFHFRALSDAVGSLEVTALSELTYYAEGSPKVTNATVNLRDAVSRAAVTNATVDTQGRLVLSALREGYYELNVSAPDHNDYRAVVLVIGGQTNAHEAFLARQTVQYVWTVEPTDFEDHYTLTVRSTFETVVPIPRLLVTPSMIDLATLNVIGTNPIQIDLTITNDGLVAARDTRLSFPAHPCWEIKPIIENLGTLSARGSVTVPVLIRKTNDANCRTCQFEGAVTWTLICANRTNGYSTPIPVLNAGDDCRPVPVILGGGGGGGFGGGGGGVGSIFFPPTLVETPPCDCAARVKLQIEQEAVVTRDAFKATLDVANNTATPLQDISVQVFVKTRAGEDVTALFEIRTNGLAGVSAVDGTGVIDAHSTGQAKWLLIPTSDAAPLTETNYLVGGRFRYMENGVTVDIPLTAVEIRVLPNPRLLVKYYWQRDVLGDDPFTPEREPSLPFSLAMMLENRGRGLARNVRITSGEPRIIDNLSGLLINFDLLASQLEMESITPSFTVNFGDIAPGTNKIAQWFLRSTLQGFFDHFEASVQHRDALGNLKLSLFDPPEIYQLIHFVRATGAGNDARQDFLVNQTRDPASLPDAVHLSDGHAEPVAAVASNIFASAVSAGQLTSTLTTPAPGGYAYLRANDPQGVNGALDYRLVAVRRSDGTYLPQENFWQTDRTFIGGGQRPVRENKIHLFDRDSTGSYTLFYEPAQTLDTTPPVSAVAVLPTSSPSVFSVNWSGADASGIVSYDLFVSQDGGAFTIWLAGTTLTSAQYPGQPGHSYAFYSVATDAPGNRESAPGVPDATTVTDFTNAPPLCPALATQTFDEDALVVLELPANDPDAPPQSLTWTLLSGPAGLTVNPQTGVLRWPTGEGSGPSTNVVNYLVCDNYSPAACCPQSLTIVVREVNTAPVIAVVTNRVIAEGSRLLIANTATDADLPAQTILWSKGAGFPTNATLDTVTGVFDWRPTASQGPSTNEIRVIATDGGSTALSATQSFTIIVRDSRPDFILSLGATNLLGGETTSVPVTLVGEPALGRVTFLIETTPGRLAGFALQDRAADVTSAVITDLGGGGHSVRFDFSGNNSSANRVLARLAFTATTNGPSTILPLSIEGLAGIRLDGSAVANTARVDGEAIVVTREPVLATRQTPPGTMALFAVPGRDYALERATNVAGPWTLAEQITAASRLERRLIDFSTVNGFYRVREIAAGLAPLAIRREAGGLIVSWPGDCANCVLEETTVMGPGAVWQASAVTAPLVSGRHEAAVSTGGGAKFFRLRQP